MTAPRPDAPAGRSPLPTDVEILAGVLLGPSDPSPVLPPDGAVGVRPALEEAILPALSRPPCLVSFSGGRDSSAVLAVALDVARRHGLPDPVPAIMRFPRAGDTEESEWQDLVLDHLAIGDRVVVDLDDELDALGALATSVLRRHGVLWPANAYMHLPLLQRAGGGSLLTGAGGDELFGSRASRLLLVAHRRLRPRWRDIRGAALAATPRRVREALPRRRVPFPRPWLTPLGRRTVDTAVARDQEAWPQAWDAAVRHWYGSRAFAAMEGAVRTVAVGLDVLVLNPFLAPAVVAEVTATGGRLGFPNRTAAMRNLFGDLLPAEVVGRRSKAGFSGAVWGPAVRAFAARWDGEGVDDRLVDVPVLRREWLSPVPNFSTALLLHRAWLALDGDGAGPGQPSVSSN